MLEIVVQGCLFLVCHGGVSSGRVVVVVMVVLVRGDHCCSSPGHGWGQGCDGLPFDGGLHCHRCCCGGRGGCSLLWLVVFCDW